MAKIFYSLSGEGRGHSTRVLAVVDMLRRRHHVTLFAYGDAYHFLEPVYWRTGVRVRAIRGMRFQYAGERLDYLRTGLKAARYYAGVMPALVDHLSEQIRAERPDLVITDFEPALPRAARRCGVPFVSLDHQHFLVVTDLSDLPADLRWWGDFIGLSVRAYFHGQVRTIVSSFYQPPLKRRYRASAVQVGTLLRPDVLRARPERRGYLVAYLRRFAPDGFLDALSQLGAPVRIYGLGERAPRGPLTFHGVAPAPFLEDLAASEALLCTAGNQIVGEALHLGKPVLAFPEPGNKEQRINAHFVRREGLGDWVAMESASRPALQRFLDKLPAYRASIPAGATTGNEAVARALDGLLAGSP